MDPQGNGFALDHVSELLLPVLLGHANGSRGLGFCVWGVGFEGRRDPCHHAPKHTRHKLRESLGRLDVPNVPGVAHHVPVRSVEYM